MRSKLGHSALVASGLAALAFAGAGHSQTAAQAMPTTIGHDAQLLITAVPARGKAALSVTSPAFAAAPTFRWRARSTATTNSPALRGPVVRRGRAPTSS
ncbi:hypothetical protein ACFSLT_19200 [Novosphingobium resinovorum]